MCRINRIVSQIYLILVLIEESRTMRSDSTTLGPFLMTFPQDVESESEVLNICEAEFDALSVIPNDLIIFVGKYVYSRRLDGFISIRDMYETLPENVKKIEAYFVDAEKNEYFFVGQDVRMFSSINSTHASSKNLELSRPTNVSTVQQIDAVFEYNGTFYVASGDQYWHVLDDNSERHPKVAYSLSDFEGAEALLPLTTAFTGRNGTTYFVKGRNYWPIDDKKKQVLTSAGGSTRDLICSQQEGEFETEPSCCADQPRQLASEIGPRALFQRYGMRQVELLDICNTKFDTITIANNGLYIFFGKYMYSSVQNEFMLLRDAYPLLPENLTKIDAYYLYPEGYEVFFIGRKVYVITNTESYPDDSIDLTALGSSSETDHIDGVFQYNGTIFAISGDQYWKVFDDFSERHPKVAYSLSDFEGAEALLPLTTAFTGRNGTTYFVKGRHYWPIDDNKKQVLTSAGRSTRDLICSQQEGEFETEPSCCADQPRLMVSEIGPRALFQRYGMRQVELLDICKTKFDTITIANNGLYIFFGKYMYSSAQNEFMLLREAYPFLPENLTKIDAYYLYPDGYEVFFIGRKVYVITNTESYPDDAIDLTALGFSSETDHIDAVFQYNGTIFAISGDQYWRCDHAGVVDEGPYDIRQLVGIHMPLSVSSSEFSGSPFFVYNGQYIMSVGKRYTLRKQEDIVCNRQILEYKSPPTCCIH